MVVVVLKSSGNDDNKNNNNRVKEKELEQYETVMQFTFLA